MLLLHFLGKKANSSCTLAQGKGYLTQTPRAIQKEGKLLWSNAVIFGTKTELGPYICSCPIPITFFLHQDMARAVYGAGFYPSVSLSIALLVKCMRIIRAVKNLLFPHSLAEKLSLLWFSLVFSGRLVTHLVCFPRNFFPKSWKSKERTAVQAVFDERRVWGECEGVSSAARGFPEAHPGPFLSFLHQLHMSSLTVPFSTLMLVDVTGFQWDDRKLQNSSGDAVWVLSFLRRSCRDRQRWGLLTSQESLAFLWSQKKDHFGCISPVLLILERRWNPDISPGLEAWLRNCSVIMHFGKPQCAQQGSSVIYLGIPEKPQFSFRGIFRKYFPSLILFLRGWGCFQMIS